MNLTEHLNTKEKAYGILAIFGVISLAFWYFADNLSIWSTTADPFLVILVMTVLNPAYLILIYWLWKEYNIRGLISGIVISVAIDIMSLPHSLLRSGMLPKALEAAPLYGYSDLSIYQMLVKFMEQGPVAVFVLEVVIPVALIWLALVIIHKNASFVKIIKKSI